MALKIAYNVFFQRFPDTFERQVHMNKVKGNILLLIAAVIWGTAFVSQKIGMNYIEPFTFGASRFLLGTLVLVPVILIFDLLKKKKAEKFDEKGKTTHRIKDQLVGGLFCGVALFLGSSLQQWGIVYTTAGKAAFVTTLYITLVPLFGILMKKKTSSIVWAGTGLALVGLCLLTTQKGFSIQKGEALVLVGTVFWTAHILIIDYYVDKTDALKLSFVQFLTAGMLSAVSAILLESPKLEAIIDCSGSILYTAVFVVGIAYSLQIIGQKHTNPTVAAIIMSMESVFAVISGSIFLDESMSERELLGCFLMFIAVIITQLKPQYKVKVLHKQETT